MYRPTWSEDGLALCARPCDDTGKGVYDTISIWVQSVGVKMTRNQKNKKIYKETDAKESG